MSNWAEGQAGIAWPLQVPSGKRVRAPLPVRSPMNLPKNGWGGGGSGRRSVPPYGVAGPSCFTPLRAGPLAREVLMRRREFIAVLASNGHRMAA